MILVKNSNFLYGLFLLKIGQEMMFGDVLDRKEAFLDNKNMYLICPKYRKYSKGFKPWFWSKISNFLHGLSFLKIFPEMMFGDVLDKKEAFLEKKICILYVQEIGNFPKGLTHDFGQKFQLSSLFLFIENRPRNKCLGMF